MEILGIGPGEFVLILIVLLVVVGPERLPGLARQAGSFLVRARNWLQTSPDAALVMRARAEIEAELASIKSSLLEVQVVRDEVMGAAKQLGDSVGSIAPPKFDINSLVNPPAEQTIAANGQVLPAGETQGLVLPDGTDTTNIPLDQRSTLELPEDNNVPIQPPAEAQPTNGLANSVGYSNARPEPTSAASAAPALGELESINIRLQAIMADMWALQQQLKQHGALDQSWQPPSLEVQLPVQDTAPLAGTDNAASEAVSADASTADTSAEHTTPVDPPPAPAPKTRKRRAVPTADQSASATAETPADGAPTAKTRKRRTPAASAQPTDETEPITTEKAS
jgi:sec-independent protein translocase protein TatB